MSVSIIEKKEVIRCRQCNAPLIKKAGDTFYILNKIDGRHIHVELKIRHTSSGVVELRCAECKGITGYNFVTLREKPKSTTKLKGTTKP